MTSATTQRLAALGTRCRRPSALLLPLTPLVMVVFAALLIVAAGRAALLRRAADSEVLTTAVRSVSSQADDHRPTGFRLRPRGIFAAASAVLGGVLLAASMAGGTYALLNAQQTTSAVTVTSGSLVVTVQASGTTAGSTTTIPTAAWSNMLPGDVVGQQITVANTGAAPVSLTFRLAATTAWDVRVAWGTCPTTQLSGSALGTTAVSGSNLAIGASNTLCVQATLPASAAAGTSGTSASLSLLVAATQVSS